MRTTVENHESPSGARTDAESRLVDQQQNGRERPWRRNRLMADALAVAYALLGWEKLAERVRKCAPVLIFGRRANGTRQLLEAFFCKVRLCSMCQWRKSRMLQQQLLKVFTAHREQRVSVVAP